MSAEVLRGIGHLLALRWGVLAFLAAMPLVWLVQFRAPRRWWLVFLSLLSLTFIACTLMPWPVDGAIRGAVYPLEDLPDPIPLAWGRRVLLGLMHAGILLAMLAGIHRLARAGARHLRERGRFWHPVRLSVLLLTLGYFALLLIRLAATQVAGPAHALDAWILLPHFHEAGLAYVYVKAVHYTWDASRGRILNLGWWRYLSWITFFPSFRVGPIERFHDFHTQILRCHRRWRPRDLGVGAARILQGSLKTVLLLVILAAAGPWALELWIDAGKDLANLPYWFPWVVVWLLAIGAYLALAGYSDIAIGIARLMGYRMVENFRWVLASHNLMECWHRVHISMSSCLRDYCYYPLMRRGPFRRRPAPPRETRAGELKRLLVPAINYPITFAVCGLWHFPAPLQAITWGLCVGSGMTVFEVWRWFWQRRAERAGPFYRVLRRAGFAGGGLPGRVLGSFVTLNFLSVTLLALFDPFAFGAFAWEIVRRPVGWIF